MPKPQDGLYILLISVHGLIRGKNLELGRDADTGGQTKYVVELARALGRNPAVAKVDLITRQVLDSKVDRDYGEPWESLDLPQQGDEGSLPNDGSTKQNSKVSIVRLPCGPRRYLRKEVLWPYLDILVDNILQHLRSIGRNPDIIHGHYADAGYVCARLVQLLGVPMLYTGHSLGRVKQMRLLEKGSNAETIESQYNMTQRIEAEEIALGNANLVITSTHQEVQEQYSRYENYHPRRMLVVPPGVELAGLSGAGSDTLPQSSIATQINRFLNNPSKPIVLALSRPDERKNIVSLIKAFGGHPKLREMANLVIIAGNRDDIQTADNGPKKVLTNILLHIDRYDLYGSVAYPKHHDAKDVGDIYRLATLSGGVFVNPALTEPFGLTLIEAASYGLPLVATHDGGPRDIIGACENGLLVDPLDIDAMAGAIVQVLSNKEQWRLWSQNGLNRVMEHFSWQSHVNKYLTAVDNVIRNSRRVSDVKPLRKNRLIQVEKLIVCDIDNTLIGDEQGLRELLDVVQQSHGQIGLAVATGRRLDSALEILNHWGVPVPDLLITAVGSEIFYGHSMVSDSDWCNHINYRWNPSAIRDVIGRMPGLKLQANSEQRKHKISYLVSQDKAKPMREVRAQLRKRDLHAKLIYSHQAYLDILPVRASKGLAIRYLAMKWGIKPEHILVAGDSGNDEEMLKGNTLGVVVGNYSQELAKLKGRPHVYFATNSYAAGIKEGIEHYEFLAPVRSVAGDESIAVNEGQEEATLQEMGTDSDV
ncbi:MAG: HAD-IIB family hydrolase [Gammaproteobacteria bacterium]|nr:HAD-IIB family hydrolase [Gammaproteobacteria bacterium]MDH5803028.1 HAD-IIB family hydrolase [Gammaproteobacteria bacterium]